MKKIKKLLNLSISYTENLYKVMLLRKVKMGVYVIFLVSMLMKRKVNLFLYLRI